MATAVRAHRRHVAHRPPWMRQRETESGAGLALGIVAVLVIGIAALVLSGQFVEVSIPDFILEMVQPSQPSRPVEGVVPAAKLSAAALAVNPTALDASEPGAASATTAQDVPDAAAAPAAHVLAAGARARVANTDGMGVVLYAAPRANARQPAGLLEGTMVTVLELSDSEWARVQADNRQAGWIHASFLALAD
jgi:hypothetical protein